MVHAADALSLVDPVQKSKIFGSPKIKQGSGLLKFLGPQSPGKFQSYSESVRGSGVFLRDVIFEGLKNG